MAAKREEEAAYRGIMPEALWLLAENRFITGQTLGVNGGFVI